MHRCWWGRARRMRCRSSYGQACRWPHVASHVTQTVFVCDLREQLRQVTVPCCIIQTMDDVVLPSPPATARFIADRLVVWPTVHMMDAGGHLPHLTAAEETASLIMPHLGD